MCVWALKRIIKLYIFAQSAESGPPLGTVLGNLGINAVKFCKEFNEITADLPNYLKLSVIINYYENNSYDIFVKEPCIGYIIGLLKAPIDVEADINTSLCYIELDEVIQLALFKWPGMPLQKSIPIAISNIEGAGIFIFDSEEKVV